MQSSPVATALVEGAGETIRYANPAFCQFSGTTLDALIGTSLLVFLADYPECSSLLERVYHSGCAATFSEQRTSESQSALLYSAWPIVSDGGRPVGMMLQVTEASELGQQAIAVSQALMLSAVRQHELAETAAELAVQMTIEIAERKGGEAALQTSQSRLLLALEFAKASTWEWDIEKNVVRWTDAIRILSGLEKTTREAPYRAWRSIIYPEDRGSVDAVAEQATKCCNELNVEFRVKSY